MNDPGRVEQADIVIVGGGIRGLSIAYCLAKKGASVALVEKGELLSGASGANVGWVNSSTKDPAPYTRLSLESRRLYQTLATELDEDIEFASCGSLLVAETEEELEPKAQFAALMNRVPGVRIEVLDRDEALDLEPAVSPHVAGAIYCASDGVVNPWKLAHAYAAAAKRLGARFHTQTTVTGIDVHAGRVTGVTTDGGTIGTDCVVSAAGIRSAHVGRMVGAEIPVVAMSGQVLVTEPLPPVLRRPVNSYTQTRQGNFTIGTTYGFLRYDRRVQHDDTIRMARQAARVVPALRRASVIRTFAAARPWPIDGLPIMGSRHDWPVGFVCAVGHSGITLAPVTGELVSELILAGRTSWPVEEFSPSRFDQMRFKFPLYAYRRLSSTRGSSAERQV